jgi:thiol-disulfide isomerase/thioredoxin
MCGNQSTFSFYHLHLLFIPILNTNMLIQTINDQQLRHLVYSRDYASVKYTSPTCDICKSLSPGYEELSERKEYSNILFLRIDSGENPTAKQFLAEQATPLIVVYHKGVVIKAGSVATVGDMTALLDELLVSATQVK